MKKIVSYPKPPGYTMDDDSAVLIGTRFRGLGHVAPGHTSRAPIRAAQKARWAKVKIRVKTRAKTTK